MSIKISLFPKIKKRSYVHKHVLRGGGMGGGGPPPPAFALALNSICIRIFKLYISKWKIVL